MIDIEIKKIYTVTFLVVVLLAFFSFFFLKYNNSAYHSAYKEYRKNILEKPYIAASVLNSVDETKLTSEERNSLYMSQSFVNIRTGDIKQFLIVQKKIIDEPSSSPQQKGKSFQLIAQLVESDTFKDVAVDFYEMFPEFKEMERLEIVLFLLDKAIAIDSLNPYYEMYKARYIAYSINKGNLDTRHQDLLKVEELIKNIEIKVASSTKVQILCDSLYNKNLINLYLFTISSNPPLTALNSKEMETSFDNLAFSKDCNEDVRNKSVLLYALFVSITSNNSDKIFFFRKELDQILGDTIYQNKLQPTRNEIKYHFNSDIFSNFENMFPSIKLIKNTNIMFKK